MSNKVQIKVGFTYSADGKVSIDCYKDDKKVSRLGIENITRLQAIVYFNGLTATYDVELLPDELMTYVQICVDAYKG